MQHYHREKISALLQTAKNKINILGMKIVKDYGENSHIDEEIIEEWLRLKNIVNMYHVCSAYYRGSAFYRSDTYHFANSKQPRSNSNETQTTISMLEPIEYYGLQKYNPAAYSQFHVCHSYSIRDDNTSPSQTLLELLFSRTSLDCFAAIQIADYLTLLDLLKLVNGPEIGTHTFDILFGPKSEEMHNLNRLRVGTMGSVWTGNWFDFSPLYFFTKPGDQSVSLNDLPNNPDKYAGSRFYIKGHDQYLKKHPEESAQGWNVVFLGLDEVNNPLFLAASEFSQRFIFTYKEMLTVLAAGYNKFPGFENNELATNFCLEKDTTGFLNNSQLIFDTQAIKLLITNPSECMKQLSEFCQQVYIHLIVRQGYDTKSQTISSIAIHPKMISTTRDDHDAMLLKSFKPDFRADPAKLTIKDDLALKSKSAIFFSPASIHSVEKLIKEAKELLDSLYSDRLNDEEICIFYEESSQSLKQMQNKLQKSMLKTSEIDKITKFTQQLREINKNSCQP